MRSSRAVRIRRRATTRALDQVYVVLARAGGILPIASPAWHGLERLADVPYLETGEAAHTLDVYRPLGTAAPGATLPAVLYVHGGAFRALSKDTHWLMALAFARRGFVVFNVNYRLAPRHRYPAAVEDVAAAYAWVAREAPRFGGDPSRLVLAGESAGANLITTLAVAAAYRRPEPAACRVFESGVTPVAALPACGVLQVSDPERHMRRRRLPFVVEDQLLTLAEDYLPENGAARDLSLDLADPLVCLERGAAPDRPLPAFFAAAGTKDPLLDDTRRLGAALDRLGVPNTVDVYPGEVHAFHALIWRPNARRYWDRAFDFLRRRVPSLEAHVRDARPLLFPGRSPALGR